MVYNERKQVSGRLGVRRGQQEASGVRGVFTVPCVLRALWACAPQADLTMPFQCPEPRASIQLWVRGTWDVHMNDWKGQERGCVCLNEQEGEKQM